MRFRYLLRLFLALMDMLLLEAAFFAIYWWRFESGAFANPIPFSAVEYIRPSLVVTAYWIILFTWFGLYRFDPLQSRAAAAIASIKATAVGVLILFIISFDISQPMPRTRIILAAYGAAIFVISSGNRLVLLTILRFLRLRGIGIMRALMIGHRGQAENILRHIKAHPELGLHVAGTAATRSGENSTLQGIPAAGSIAHLRSLLQSGRFDVVVLAPEPSEEYRLARILKILRRLRIRSFISASQYHLLVGEVKPTRVYGHPIVDIRPDVMSVVERILKRATDIVIALVVLMLSLPLALFLVCAIPLESKGPAIYAQRRVGLNGRIFTLLKFRSMRPDAESLTGPVMAVARDPRVTRLGRVMRAMRIDELPQLINVLLGQMSLVGPRPEREEFVRQFAKDIPLYERRLNVKPGITGWSQVHLKYDSSPEQTRRKLSYDFYYIENMSLPLDVKIMFMTLFVMLRGEGL
jgi:exopolysaccharide biosynthesis polyprenyl glycosylphosphotransferase